MLKSLFFISLITSVVQASDDRSSPITLNFVADVKEFLGRHEKVSVIGLFGAQDGSIRTIFRSVLSSFDGSVIFADSTADRVLNHFDKKGDPLVLLFRNFDSLESQTKLQYEGPWDFSSLKSFVFSQSLPPIVAIGSPKSGDDPSELTRISNAFRQTTVSKFIVLTHGSLGSDLSNILIEFANEFHGKLVVMHVDIDAANDIGASLLRMGGLSVTDVRDDKERPLALMVGDSGTLEFDGYYEHEPLAWFVTDWIEQGSGGSSGVWLKGDTKRDKNSKSTNKKSAKSKKSKVANKEF